MESEAQIRSEWILCRDLPSETQRLKQELSLLHAEVETFRAAASAKAEHTSAHPSASAVSSMPKEDLLQELGRARGAMAQLEIELAGTKKKAEIFESRVAELEVISLFVSSSSPEP